MLITYIVHVLLHILIFLQSSGHVRRQSACSNQRNPMLVRCWLNVIADYRIYSEITSGSTSARMAQIVSTITTAIKGVGCACMCLYLFVHVCVCACMCMFVCMCVCVHMCVCACVCVCMYVYACVCTCTCMCV